MLLFGLLDYCLYPFIICFVFFFLSVNQKGGVFQIANRIKILFDTKGKLVKMKDNFKICLCASNSCHSCRSANGCVDFHMLRMTCRLL